MKLALSRFCILVFAALSSGCLEFEEQTMSYRFLKDADELRIFQDYRGIFGADARGKAGVPLSGGELDELKSVLEGQRTFFFNNWISEYNREEAVKALASLGDTEESDIAAEDIPAIKKLLTLLIDNVHVSNGPCYLGAEGKLCGVQSVTVSRCSEIIAALNHCAPIFLRDIAEKENTTEGDRKAIAKFAKDDKSKMLTLDGNVFTLRWPMSRKSHDTAFTSTSEDRAKAEEIHAAGIGISWADGVTTFVLGKKDEQITRLTLKFSKTQYTPNAVAPVRAAHEIKEQFDPQSAAKSFLLGKGSGK